MELFAQLVFMGCAEGSVYALIAMTFGLIVYVTRVFHLAHGAVLAIAAYSIHYLTRFLEFPVWASVLFTFPISALFGIGTSVLLVEQNARCAFQMAQKLYILKLGQIVYSGDRNILLNEQGLWDKL